MRQLYVTIHGSSFESKIPNDSNVIAFTRNHTDNREDDDQTKNNMYPPVTLVQPEVQPKFWSLNRRNVRAKIEPKATAFGI